MRKKTVLLKDIFGVGFIIFFGTLSLFFGLSYIDSLKSGLFFLYRKNIERCYFILIVSSCLSSFVLLKKEDSVFKKISFLFIFCASSVSIFLFYFDKSGLKNKISSVEDFRAYVGSFGGYTAIIYVCFQFLQVVLIPIPSFITVGAGVLLFGPFRCAVYSYIGIICGTYAAFFSGRYLGGRFVKWLIGEKALEKGLSLIKGKDKIILTFMFLFPFFPDDALCFISGITKIKTSFFIVMSSIVRLLTVFASAYSINNSLIPYNTVYGIIIWILFFIITIIMTILVYKKGEKIERGFARRIKRKKVNK